MKSVFIILFLCFLGISIAISTVYAQDSTTVTDSTYRNRMLFLPAIGARPETGFLFGAVVVPQLNRAMSDPKHGHPASLSQEFIR